MVVESEVVLKTQSCALSKVSLPMHSNVTAHAALLFFNKNFFPTLINSQVQQPASTHARQTDADGENVSLVFRPPQIPAVLRGCEFNEPCSGTFGQNIPSEYCQKIRSHFHKPNGRFEIPFRLQSSRALLEMSDTR